MTGREHVELDIRFRVDRLEPVEDGTSRYTPVVTSTVADTPLIIIRDLVQIDELMLGHCIAMLITAAENDARMPRPLKEWGSSSAPGEFPHYLLDGDTDGGQP